jgi:hypothetical protein
MADNAVPAADAASWLSPALLPPTDHKDLILLRTKLGQYRLSVDAVMDAAEEWVMGKTNIQQVSLPTNSKHCIRVHMFKGKEPKGDA